jgi:hypothetical protein
VSNGPAPRVWRVEMTAASATEGVRATPSCRSLFRIAFIRQAAIRMAIGRLPHAAPCRLSAEPRGDSRFGRKPEAR